ncbi:tubulin-folding cofactor B-like [Limulus polyphemus]|uniref:Tubulin-folding cofactor B-like n=1 Tax=Limulus polyphemus TaxID=6850 RepID=A0ABM1SIX7_LIMPO|nr:tubulin-folding cofactor B-like [Limulus polyphemus]XP_013776288.1 tubulin-folding cofactor B-like [Limulus polyphemus]XP_022243582.1 tubulin-folding cofactor B-like [Limulus polyphemus]
MTSEGDQGWVKVFVSSNVSSFLSERRFQKDLSIAEVKGKLELLTGASAASMKLELHNKDNELVASLDNDTASLSSYPIIDGMRISVIDSSSTAGEFEDTSKVEKFELSNEEYAQRAESLRAFKMQNKLGQFDEEKNSQLQKIKAEKEKKIKEMVEKISVGNRCEVHLSGHPVRRGTVMFVGETHFKPGYWVGVRYDEPQGKNDGSVQGKRYFECPENYGGFVRPLDITVGNFPEKELDLEDDEI